MVESVIVTFAHAFIYTYLPADLHTYLHTVLAAFIALGALWIVLPTPAPEWLQRSIRCPLRATSTVLAKRRHNGEQLLVQSAWPTWCPLSTPLCDH